MKTYVLMISKYFPATHKRAGEETNFFNKIESYIKMHTIRFNYELWEKRISEINKGNACLCLREWEGKPYRSKQKNLYFFEGNEVGIQKLEWTTLGWLIDEFYSDLYTKDLAANDGLSLEDFKEWFKKYPVEPMAIIHFTEFRY